MSNSLITILDSHESKNITNTIKYTLFNIFYYINYNRKVSLKASFIIVLVSFFQMCSLITFETNFLNIDKKKTLSSILMLMLHYPIFLFSELNYNFLLIVSIFVYLIIFVMTISFCYLFYNNRIFQFYLFKKKNKCGDYYFKESNFTCFIISKIFSFFFIIYLNILYLPILIILINPLVIVIKSTTITNLNLITIVVNLICIILIFIYGLVISYFNAFSIGDSNNHVDNIVREEANIVDAFQNYTNRYDLNIFILKNLCILFYHIYFMFESFLYIGMIILLVYCVKLIIDCFKFILYNENKKLGKIYIIFVLLIFERIFQSLLTKIVNRFYIVFEFNDYYIPCILISFLSNYLLDKIYFEKLKNYCFCYHKNNIFNSKTSEINIIKNDKILLNKNIKIIKDLNIYNELKFSISNFVKYSDSLLKGINTINNNTNNKLSVTYALKFIIEYFFGKFNYVNNNINNNIQKLNDNPISINYNKYYSVLLAHITNCFYEDCPLNKLIINNNNLDSSIGDNCIINPLNLKILSIDHQRECNKYDILTNDVINNDFIILHMTKELYSYFSLIYLPEVYNQEINNSNSIYNKKDNNINNSIKYNINEKRNKFVNKINTNRKNLNNKMIFNFNDKMLFIINYLRFIIFYLGNYEYALIEINKFKNIYCKYTFNKDNNFNISLSNKNDNLYSEYLNNYFGINTMSISDEYILYIFKEFCNSQLIGINDFLRNKHNIIKSNNYYKNNNINKYNNKNLENHFYSSYVSNNNINITNLNNNLNYNENSKYNNINYLKSKELNILTSSLNQKKWSKNLNNSWNIYNFVTIINYNQKITELKNIIYIILLKKRKTWTSISSLAESGICNIESIFNNVYSYLILQKKAKLLWYKLNLEANSMTNNRNSYIDNSIIKLFYKKFLNEICNNSNNKKDFYINENEYIIYSNTHFDSSSLNIKNNINKFEYDNINKNSIINEELFNNRFKSDIGIIIIELSPLQCGDILYVNNALCNILKYDYKDLIDYQNFNIDSDISNLAHNKKYNIKSKRNISIILPNVIGNIHSKLVLNYFKKGYSNFINRSINNLYIKDKQNNLIPVQFVVSILPSLNSRIEGISIIKKKQHLEEVIITDYFGNIDCTTKIIRDKFVTTAYFLNNNSYIINEILNNYKQNYIEGYCNTTCLKDFKFNLNNKNTTEYILRNLTIFHFMPKLLKPVFYEYYINKNENDLNSNNINKANLGISSLFSENFFTACDKKIELKVDLLEYIDLKERQNILSIINNKFLKKKTTKSFVSSNIVEKSIDSKSSNSVINSNNIIYNSINISKINSSRYIFIDELLIDKYKLSVDILYNKKYNNGHLCNLTENNNYANKIKYNKDNSLNNNKDTFIKYCSPSSLTKSYQKILKEKNTYLIEENKIFLDKLTNILTINYLTPIVYENLKGIKYAYDNVYEYYNSKSIINLISSAKKDIENTFDLNKYNKSSKNNYNNKSLNSNLFTRSYTKDICYNKILTDILTKQNTLVTNKSTKSYNNVKDKINNSICTINNSPNKNNYINNDVLFKKSDDFNKLNFLQNCKTIDYIDALTKFDDNKDYNLDRTKCTKNTNLDLNNNFNILLKKKEITINHLGISFNYKFREINTINSLENYSKYNNVYLFRIFTISKDKIHEKHEKFCSINMQNNINLELNNCEKIHNKEDNLEFENSIKNNETNSNFNIHKINIEKNFVNKEKDILTTENSLQENKLFNLNKQIVIKNINKNNTKLFKFISFSLIFFVIIYYFAVIFLSNYTYSLSESFLRILKLLSHRNNNIVQLGKYSLLKLNYNAFKRNKIAVFNDNFIKDKTYFSNSSILSEILDEHIYYYSHNLLNTLNNINRIGIEFNNQLNISTNNLLKGKKILDKSNIISSELYKLTQTILVNPFYSHNNSNNINTHYSFKTLEFSKYNSIKLLNQLFFKDIEYMYLFIFTITNKVYYIYIYCLLSIYIILVVIFIFKIKAYINVKHKYISTIKLLKLIKREEFKIIIKKLNNFELKFDNIFKTLIIYKNNNSIEYNEDLRFHNNTQYLYNYSEESKFYNNFLKLNKNYNKESKINSNIIINKLNIFKVFGKNNYYLINNKCINTNKKSKENIKKSRKSCFFFKSNNKNNSTEDINTNKNIQVNNNINSNINLFSKTLILIKNKKLFFRCLFFVIITFTTLLFNIFIFKEYIKFTQQSYKIFNFNIYNQNTLLYLSYKYELETFNLDIIKQNNTTDINNFTQLLNVSYNANINTKNFISNSFNSLLSNNFYNLFHNSICNNDENKELFNITTFNYNYSNLEYELLSNNKILDNFRIDKSVYNSKQTEFSICNDLSFDFIRKKGLKFIIFNYLEHLLSAYNSFVKYPNKFKANKSLIKYATYVFNISPISNQSLESKDNNTSSDLLENYIINTVKSRRLIEYIYGIYESILITFNMNIKDMMIYKLNLIILINSFSIIFVLLFIIIIGGSIESELKRKKKVIISLLLDIPKDTMEYNKIFSCNLLKIFDN